MIDRKETISILKSFVAGEANGNPTGFYSATTGSPLYSDKKHLSISICAAGRKNPRISTFCRKFYENLPLGTSSAQCPYGITIEYVKKECVLGPVGVFVQKAFTKDTSSSLNILKVLPRQSKKIATIALEKSSQYTFLNTEPNLLIIDKFKRLLDTLLAGRVADSIRTLAHELLTPVQGALNDAYKIQDTFPRTKEKETIDLLIKNISSIENLSKRIQYLLVEDLKHETPHLRKITVHDVIHKICEQNKGIADKKLLELAGKYNPHHKQVEAVPDQAYILFSVLLENAIKYSFTGFSDKKNKITISYDEIGTNLEISICNLGCLITAEEIKERRIFQLGARGENSNDRGKQGTGSGLFIADKIIKAHSGKICVTSDPIEGQDNTVYGKTTFTVVWPIYAP